MSLFPSVLREMRKERGLTQRELAEKVGKTSTYIAALEAENSDRDPSMNTLRHIIKALASRRDTQGSYYDFRYVIRLALAAVGLPAELPNDVEDADAFYKAMDAADEVWILTDTLREAQSPEYATYTAGKINHSVRFVFVVPFSTSDGTIELACNNLLRAGVSDSNLQASVAIFRVSNVGTPIRLWLVNPQGTRPQGFCDFGPCVDVRPDIRRLPASQLAYLIRAYAELCALHKVFSSFHDAKPREAVGTKELGYISLAYPLNANARVPIPMVGDWRRSDPRLVISGAPGARISGG